MASSGDSTRTNLAGGAPCVLLTGFDAFGGDSVNPSWLAVQALDGRTIAAHRVVAAQLPTVFGTSGKVLKRLMRDLAPELVICVGLAGGRGALSIERVALNCSDASIADNAGAQPLDLPVVAGGPAAYFSTLPIKAIVQRLREAGVPAEVSQTAGTFVCNHVFYGLMHAVTRLPHAGRPRAGFVHVPFLNGQGTPSMALAEIVRGLEMCVEVALTRDVDARYGAGKVS
ncbi:MAG: pcp [Polaromonas sp.]|nr:pcp [Polaromonas sp.]